MRTMLAAASHRLPSTCGRLHAEFALRTQTRTWDELSAALLPQQSLSSTSTMNGTLVGDERAEHCWKGCGKIEGTEVSGQGALASTAMTTGEPGTATPAMVT
jgi:hypothetical protein